MDIMVRNSIAQERYTQIYAHHHTYCCIREYQSNSTIHIIVNIHTIMIMILVIARQIIMSGKIRILRQTTNDILNNNINDDNNNNHHHHNENNKTDFNRQA